MGTKMCVSGCACVDTSYTVFWSAHTLSSNSGSWQQKDPDGIDYSYYVI